MSAQLDTTHQFWQVERPAAPVTAFGTVLQGNSQEFRWEVGVKMPEFLRILPPIFEPRNIENHWRGIGTVHRPRYGIVSKQATCTADWRSRGWMPPCCRVKLLRLPREQFVRSGCGENPRQSNSASEQLSNGKGDRA